jgi:hypothetical protein
MGRTKILTLSETYLLSLNVSHEGTSALTAILASKDYGATLKIPVLLLFILLVILKKNDYYSMIPSSK